MFSAVGRLVYMLNEMQNRRMMFSAEGKLVYVRVNVIAKGPLFNYTNMTLFTLENERPCW